jgi:hypothetical protein
LVVSFRSTRTLGEWSQPVAKKKIDNKQSTNQFFVLTYGASCMI